jgi:ribose 5-phosphate isomerase A
MAFVSAPALFVTTSAVRFACSLNSCSFAPRPASRIALIAPGASRRVGGVVRDLVSAVAMSSIEELKKQTGYKAVDDYVTSGMVVGLGTGSTAYYAVERLGEKLASGELEDVVAIPTSIRTRDQALALNIPLVTLDTHPKLDVAIDGADEVDPALNLVKGRGGALLREKMVEVQAEKFIVIVDDSKLVPGLGISGAMPVEVTPFCWEFNLRRLQELDSVKGCEAKLRMSAEDSTTPYVTDNDNFIVDLYFKEPIADPAQAARDFDSLVGVVEHGLFLGMSTAVIIAGKTGIEVKTA